MDISENIDREIEASRERIGEIKSQLERMIDSEEAVENLSKSLNTTCQSLESVSTALQAEVREFAAVRTALASNQQFLDQFSPQDLLDRIAEVKTLAESQHTQLDEIREEVNAFKQEVASQQKNGNEILKRLKGELDEGVRELVKQNETASHERRELKQEHQTLKERTEVAAADAQASADALKAMIKEELTGVTGHVRRVGRVATIAAVMAFGAVIGSGVGVYLVSKSLGWL